MSSPVNSYEASRNKEQIGKMFLEIGQNGYGLGNVALRLLEGRPLDVDCGFLLQMDFASSLVNGSRRLDAVLLQIGDVSESQRFLITSVSQELGS